MKMVSYSVFSFLFPCLETMARKQIWMRKTSVTVMVVVWKYHSENCLTAALFKVCYRLLGATFTAVFWKTRDSWRFTDMNQHTCNFFLVQLSRKEYRRRCLQKHRLHKTLNLHFKELFTNMEDHSSIIFIRFFFCSENLSFKFNLLLIK